MRIKYGSVCSGIEAATVAWHSLGWEAAWLSEIEAFPSAVLAHHYPDVPNLGDMTLIPNAVLSSHVEAPDLLVGGTPCQAFSVAGLRNSLEDNRGQLSITYIKLLDAVDSVRGNRGEQPAIALWENVPGVLSTKDNAFGCFLAGLAGEDEALVPSGGKWTNAGYVLGPKRTVAWRVLDAQYFGVAQRRRRVFVVASAREDFSSPKVLFEPESLRRDTPPSREKREDVAGTIAARFGISRNNHEECVVTPVAGRSVAFDKQRLGEYGDNDVASTCAARDYKDATDLVVQPSIVHGTQDPCNSDIAFAQGRNNGGENVLIHAMQVRRLTPVECERLQGFPDNYTNIPWRKKDESPDGPRYKALGNSMAVPVMKWIGERIQMEENLCKLL